jgi:hypothetical protein
MMPVLHIEPSLTTPEIHFDAEKGYFSIKGSSYPENSLKFYEPVIQYLAEFVRTHVPDPTKTLILETELNYFNTSTAKVLLDIFRYFEQLYEKGQPVKVRWLYLEDDTEMEDAGLDYQAAVKLPFELVALHEET